MLQQQESGAVQPNVSPSSQQQAESGGVQIQPNVSPSLQQPAESGGVQVQPNVSPSSQPQAESGGVQIQPNVSPSLQQQAESGGVQVQPNVSPSSQQQAESGGAQVQPNVSPSSQQQTESGGEIQPNVSPSLQQTAESGGVQVQPKADPSLKKPAKSIDFFLRPPKSINGLPAGNLGENAHQPPLSEAEIAAVKFLYWPNKKKIVDGKGEGRNDGHYRQLNLAATKGDWKSAQSIIKSDPNALTARITPDSQTALHVAAIFCRWEFILKLLEDLKPELIEVRDTRGDTILHQVAGGGSLKTAKALIQKNARLLQMYNHRRHLPLHYSIWSGSKELVWYLTSITEPIESASLHNLIRFLIQFGFHDIALYFVTKYPNSTLAKDQLETSLLHWLVSGSQHFFSGSNLGFLERLIYKLLGRFKRLFWKAITQLAPTIKIVRDTKLKNKCAVKLVDHVCKHLSSMSFIETFNFLQYPYSVMGDAVKAGNEEVVRTLLQYFPDLIDIEALPQRNILQVAIEYRQEKIINIMKEIYSTTVITSSCTLKMASENTTLHLVGKLAPAFKLHSVSSSALQMQRELLWFKVCACGNGRLCMMMVVDCACGGGRWSTVVGWA
ncbi:hypothetical protein EZV62_003539 [Acer yangbiense]|uniref:Uncharacterized protein n=1 Tax=Acer yangbiense TaxID=1000413 RepID=A0A5C7II00_9ROSI|nr:hypothetical protein EZV62_003539 [Acer yangbiense]